MQLIDYSRVRCRDLEGNKKVLRRAERTLQREREWLAQQLKAAFGEADREALFERWHIRQMKERKKALSLRLWHPDVCATHMQLSHVSVSC